MLGHELAVEKREVSDLEARDEPCQRDLRCVGGAAEHGFAEEGAAQLHAIETADEIISPPTFDRVGMAGREQAHDRAFDCIVDPGFVPVGAGEEDIVEGRITGHAKLPRSQPLG